MKCDLCVYQRYEKIINKERQTQRIKKVCVFTGKSLEETEGQGLCKFEEREIKYFYSRKKKR